MTIEIGGAPSPWSPRRRLSPASFQGYIALDMWFQGSLGALQSCCAAILPDSRGDMHRFSAPAVVSALKHEPEGGGQ